MTVCCYYTVVQALFVAFFRLHHFFLSARNEILCPAHALVQIVKFFFAFNRLAVNGYAAFTVAVLIGIDELPGRNETHKPDIVAEEIAEFSAHHIFYDCVDVNGQTAQIDAFKEIVDVHIGTCKRRECVERTERCGCKSRIEFDLVSVLFASCKITVHDGRTH